MSDVGDRRDAWLSAGALLPPDWPAPDGVAIDAVAARVYTHPGPGERVVIRLVPETLAAAQDVALADVGLQLQATVGPVAIARQRPLGFAGWMLLHRPELRAPLPTR